MEIIKKNGHHQTYDFSKIKKAVTQSAQRVNVKFNEDQWKLLEKSILTNLGQAECITVEQMHNAVELSLDLLNEKVSLSYKTFRNYKKDFANMMTKVLLKADEVNYHVDKSNANTTATLVSTKRSLIYGNLNKERYKKFFSTLEENQALEDGYIYAHDMSARPDTYNCCLFDSGKVLCGGFKKENMRYTEPKDVKAAFGIIKDTALDTAAQQYGGFTLSEIDSVLAPYARKSFNRYLKKSYERRLSEHSSEPTEYENMIILNRARKDAMEDLTRDLEQGFQALEYAFNTVASSRGDFPFITISGGCEEDEFGQLVWKTALKVRREGEGEEGLKKPAIFPKIVFLYTKELHAPGKPLYDLYKEGIITSSKTMYPDWLSLDMPDPSDIKTDIVMNFEPSIAKVFHKYHKFGVSRWLLDEETQKVYENPEWVDAIVSPMGCRAYLSPLYKSGHLKPVDENDMPTFIGRFNGGAVSLNLPMIYMKAKDENRDFYEVLDYYLNMINDIHIRTYNFLCSLKASCNPVAFCEGGFGNLEPEDSIEPLVNKITFSYGFTALNELEWLAEGKSLYDARNEDNFALNVLKYVNNYVENKKKEREAGIVPYIAAIYATPAESLCLAGNTLVQTYDGYKEIKDIKVNDLVYSFNEITNKIELKPVIFAGKTGENRTVVKVKFTNGQEVICTPNHPFAVRKVNQDAYGVFSGGEHLDYIEAENLKPGDRVKSNYIKLHGEYLETSSDKSNLIVESVEVINKLIDVYDITVQDNHNFYVGGEDGILVHNCGTQVEQFRDKYGIIKNVSDKPYFTNSFHMWVGENITPFEKQDAEYNYFHISSGGHIQYCRFPNGDNLTMIDKTVRRAMKLGYYFGVNMQLGFCEECGCTVEDGVNECPFCGSHNVTKVDRVCGYLGYSRVNGDTKMNDAKMAEVADRKSM